MENSHVLFLAFGTLLGDPTVFTLVIVYTTLKTQLFPENDLLALSRGHFHQVKAF